MGDPRMARLARVVVLHSLAVIDGDLLQVVANLVAAPLVHEVYREALLAGAHPVVRFGSETADELLYRHGSDEQLRFISPMDRVEAEKVTARLFIKATQHAKVLTHSDPAKVALRGQAQAEVRNRIFERAAAGQARWCVTTFPTEAGAKDAELSLREFEDLVYRACKVDEQDPVAAWEAVGAEQQRLADLLSAKQTIRLVAPDTDLTYRCQGRPWTSCAGKRNLPDGEIFTSPHEADTEGHIRFTTPAVYGGREIDDVCLVFRQGRVVEATATKGQALLESLLDTDEGARRLGEAAFGLNYDHQRLCGDVLLDEKVGGTIHLGLGWANPAFGGTNQSKLALYLVCDLRRGGRAYADGQLIYSDGRFVV